MPAVDAEEEAEEAGDDLEDLDLDMDDEGDSDAEVELDIDMDDEESEEELELPDGEELGDAEGMLADLGDMEMGDMDDMDDMDMEDELDLTGASDEEVLSVFKKMGDEDEIEVVKDEDGITLKDNQTGAEYYIKESDEELEEGELCEGCGSYDESEEGMEEGEETIYEVEIDEDMVEAFRLAPIFEEGEEITEEDEVAEGEK